MRLFCDYLCLRAYILYLLRPLQCSAGVLPHVTCIFCELPLDWREELLVTFRVGDKTIPLKNQLEKKVGRAQPSVDCHMAAIFKAYQSFFYFDCANGNTSL